MKIQRKTAYGLSKNIILHISILNGRILWWALGDISFPGSNLYEN
jgi:hypothetical protein